MIGEDPSVRVDGSSPIMDRDLRSPPLSFAALIRREAERGPGHARPHLRLITEGWRSGPAIGRIDLGQDADAPLGL